MAKNKRILSRTGAAETPPQRSAGMPLTHTVEDAHSIAAIDLQPAKLPAPWLLRTISIVIALHFASIGLSYLSTIAPSSLQVRVVDLFRPYLSLFHLEADNVALNLATSAPKEKTHLLEQSLTARSDADAWTELTTTGVPGGDRQRRWQRYLSLVAEMGENEQAAFAAWLVEPLAERFSDAKALRIKRAPDLMTTVVDDNASPPYTAAVLRETNAPVRIVFEPAQRLASPPLPAPTGSKP